MSRLSFVVPVVASLSIGFAAFAQDTTTEDGEATAAEAEAPETTTETTTETAETQSTETDAAENSDVAADLDMGQEVTEEPTYIKETYGDWQLQCFRSEAPEDLCQMYQLLREDAGNPVAEISLFRLPEGSPAVAGATVVVPLGTLLTKQLQISVDGGKAKSFSYSFCSMVGCFARIGLTEADLDAFKRGNEAVLRIIPAQAPDQTVDIKASLSGFTAAFENVSTVNN